MMPFKRPEKPDQKRPFKGRPKADDDARSVDRKATAQTKEEDAEEASEAKPAPDARRREGQRKLRAAVERSDDTKPSRPKLGDAKPKESGRRSESEKKKARSGPSLKQRAAAGARSARSGSHSLLVALITVLAAGSAVIFAILGRALAVVLRIWLFLRPPARTVANKVRRAINAAARVATPKLVLSFVVAGAAILLALSQWVDYRSISIGTDAYSGLEAIAPPPEVERAETGDPHGYLFAPIGLICLGLLVVALRGRSSAARLIAVAGFAAVLVALLVDRPAGLDISNASMSFEGVEAKLLGGFYAQIAAGLVLMTSSLLLASVLRSEAPSRSPRSDPKSAERPSRDRRRVRGAEA